MKTFIQLMGGDEFFYAKITNSKIVSGEEGTVMKGKIQNVIRSCDMKTASFAITKPDGIYSTVTLDLNASVHVSYRAPEDEVSLNVEIYGTDANEVYNKALSIINSRLTQIDAIKRRCNKNIDELLIAATVLEVEQRNSKNEVNLEEAASMAL
jgi:hypothetical protein